MGSASRLIARWAERCLWTIGFLALTAMFAVWFNARQQQAAGNQELNRRLEATRTEDLAPQARLAQGDLIGRIEIPRLQVSSVVFEGTDDDVLRIGVGHLPGSPLPDEHGNVVLAAHRDTFFRSLRNIHNQDVIDVVTPSVTRRYRVESMAIVTPDHVEVLGPTPGASLTLVTCYPFDWFGHAPKRFVVRARAVDQQSHDKGSRSQNAVPFGRPPVGTPVHSQTIDMQIKRATSPARTTPAEQRFDLAPAAPELEPEQSNTLSAERTVKVGASKAIPAVQRDGDVVEPSAGSDDKVPPNGNPMLRGLKKLNPKHLLARIAGQ